jgi:hypothetical protein
MGINILAKFCCFMATRFWTADIQNCQKEKEHFFFGTNCIRKSGMTSALIEAQSSFYAHFRANEMHFPVTY